MKPVVKLVGADGNVFNLLGLCTKALKQHSQAKEAAELANRVFSCHSYGEALRLMGDYVEIQ